MKNQHTHEERRRKHFALLGGILLGMLLLSTALIWTARTSAATTQTTVNPLILDHWTPVGHTWTLTVSFLTGSRQGQSEISLMTFQQDERLTATFPHSDQLPAIDGRWSMSGPHTFHYRFRDLLMQNGYLFGYVQVQIDAYLTSQDTYVAGGVGVIYSSATGKPLPEGYNITQTVATAS